MIRGEFSSNDLKAYLAEGEWEKVIDICQKAIALDPNAINFYPYLAKAYAEQGQLAAAITTYKKTLGTKINQAEVYAELGLLYSRQKNLEQAAWHYEQALSLKSDWGELFYNLGIVYHQLGNWDKAITAYTRSGQINPNYSAAYFNLGVLYEQKGESEKAIASYQQVIKIDPTFIRAYSNLGSVYAKQQEYTKAIATFKAGIRLDPTWATLHNNLGQVYCFNEQPGDALNSFEMAITLDPTMALAHHNLGKLWQQQGNYPQAIKCIERVIELEPHNVLAYSNCGQLQQKMGDLAAVMAQWRKIIEQESDFIDAYCEKRLSCKPEDLLETAKVNCALFLQALKHEEITQAYNYLSLAYAYMGDVLFEFGGISQAQMYYQMALDIKPQEVELYLKLGNIFAKQQRLDAAIATYQIGLTFEPEHPQICFQLGKVLERTQNAEQAINYYEAVLNQQIDRTGQWQNLPNLFTVEENLALLPQKIYHYTQDWARDSQLTDFNYTQVLWDDNHNSTITGTIKGSREAEIIQPKIPGKSSYPECGGVNCVSCTTKLLKHFQPQQIGKNVYQCNLHTTPPVKSRLPFVATIPRGKTWIAPQKNSWIITNAIAVITPDNYLLGDVSRYYPWFLPGCPYQEKTDHRIYELETIPPLEKIKGRVALLSGLAGHVYYHWMFDILPRLELIQRSGIKLEEIDWFIVNSLSKNYQKETLELLNIPTAKIIESDRTSYIQAEELIVPSFPGYMDWIPQGTMKFLRQTFLTQISLSQRNDLKRIYISRERAKNRQLVNESQVNELLTKHGFQTIFLEEMSVLEQVATFANADVIVAPHGSGLTNLVFCSPNTKVVELFSPNYVRTDYLMISQQLNLQHYYLIGRNFDCSSLRNLMYQNPLTEDIWVDITALKLVLQHLAQIPATY
ncbi:TPR domain protein [Chondrocystis sp. NIES-4102]|nr:TPR domain protein [Chondrocystis sp. NIES-4102]